MFGSSKEKVTLAPGSRFQRRIGGLFTELAEVLWVNEEPCGIPHVHYVVQLRYEGTDLTSEASHDRRTLSLAAFCNRYRGAEVV